MIVIVFTQTLLFTFVFRRNISCLVVIHAALAATAVSPEALGLIGFVKESFLVDLMDQTSAASPIKSLHVNITLMELECLVQEKVEHPNARTNAPTKLTKSISRPTNISAQRVTQSSVTKLTSNKNFLTTDLLKALSLSTKILSTTSQVFTNMSLAKLWEVTRSEFSDGESRTAPNTGSLQTGKEIKSSLGKRVLMNLIFAAGTLTGETTVTSRS